MPVVKSKKRMIKKKPYKKYRIPASVRNAVMAKPSFKVRLQADVSSTAGGVITEYIQTQTIDAALNGSTAFQDVTSLSNLYDDFKVMAIKIRWIPYAPNDDSSIRYYRPIYVVYDVDSSGSNPITSENVAIGYQNCKIMNLYKPWTVYYKILPCTGGTYQTVDGFQDFANIHNLGVIGIYSTGLNNSTSYGKLIVDCYLMCKARR